MNLNKVSDQELKQEFIRRFYVFDEKPIVNNSVRCNELLTAHYINLDQTREHFSVIYLNGRNQVIDIETEFTGSITSSAVYPREIMKKVLNKGAVSVIFAHNHPSGNNNPSQDDKRITDRLKAALGHIDVSVLDHIILAGAGFYSFSENGLI
ncbi:MAG: DNA repair protein RadC [Candidatus Brocadiales bacterium]|nr:DNA repair protein RadC [Candidatus Brocadiales bacterium]